MMDWQPIETAPMDGTQVLLFDRYERSREHARFVGVYRDCRWLAIPGAYSKRPTHWQPLPPPPADGDPS